MDGTRRMEYLLDAVSVACVCSIQLESVLPPETFVWYPRCIGGEGSVCTRGSSALTFNEKIETGTDLPDGFDAEFFDPAQAQFVDSMEEEMWTTFLESEMGPLIAMDIIRTHQGLDTRRRFLVQMPGPYYDLLLNLELLKTTESRDYNPFDALDLVPLWFSKTSLHKLADAIEVEKARHHDPRTARRLAAVSTCISRWMWDSTVLSGGSTSQKRRRPDGRRQNRTCSRLPAPGCVQSNWRPASCVTRASIAL